MFRTDLRLRPHPPGHPLALSIDDAELYYERHGQNWERAALIKARVVAGDRAAGDGFLRALEPFLWRRHLDYAAIRDIHSIKRQINAYRGYRHDPGRAATTSRSAAAASARSSSSPRPSS